MSQVAGGAAPAGCFIGIELLFRTSRKTTDSVYLWEM
jgi:hypothetical protein